jgi:hypothetical protein
MVKPERVLFCRAVVQSFTCGDVDQSKKFVHIFMTMNRLGQLKHYYRTVQKNLLQQSWTEAVDMAETSGTNRFIREFYDYLVEVFQKQKKWCMQVFDDSSETILVLAEFLVSMQPSRENVITAALKRSTEKLDIIKDFSEANIYFGITLSRVLENQKEIPHSHVQTLSQAVFDFFNVFIRQYSSLESTFLSNKLNSLVINEQTAADTVRNLESANGRFTNWIEDSLKRCSDITQNCGLPSLLNVLVMLIKIYLDKYRKAQKQLLASRSSREDWGLLQLCINLLQYLGEINVYLLNLEAKIGDELLKKYEEHESNGHLFKYKISGKREWNELQKLAITVKESRLKSLDNSAGKDGIMTSVFELVQKICVEIHDTTLAIAFSPVEEHFKNIEPPASNANDNIDLPDYSFAPQEYITQVGQFLLTLPQHLEPLLLSIQSNPLKLALQLCDEKYSRNVPSADILLALVAEECCAIYQEQIESNIFTMKKLSNSAAKQLATDIEYLGSVLEELGLSLGSYLLQTAALLRAPADKYLQLSAGCQPQLVTVIRQLRQIVSAE